MLVHLLDGASPHPLDDFAAINRELEATDTALARKDQLVVFNKMDLPEARAAWPRVCQAIEEGGYPCLAISAITHEGVATFIRRLSKMLDALPPPAPSPEIEKVFRPAESEHDFVVSREPDGTWVVSGRHVERLAAITRWDEYEAVQHLQRQLRAAGVHAALEKAGVNFGDTVRIGDVEMEWS